MQKKVGRNPTENVGIWQVSSSRIKISKLGEQLLVFQQVPLGAIIFRERQLVTLNIVLTQQTACPNLLYFHLHYWFENSPGFMIHIMLAHVLLETEMLSLHFTVLLDLGETQRNLGFYRNSDKTLSLSPQQIIPPGETSGGLDSFQLKPKSISGYTKASLICACMYMYPMHVCVHVYTHTYTFVFLQENCRKRSVIITHKFG